jgi:hypothetical protein
LGVRLQPVTQPGSRGVAEMQRADGGTTQDFIQHIPRGRTTIGLQRIDRPDQPAMRLDRRRQPRVFLRRHPAQQGQKLPIQFADRAFIDQEPAPLQIALDLDQLAMVVFVLPANQGHHIKPIGAIGQTNRQDAAGIVGRARMGTVRVAAAVAFAGDKERAASARTS